MSPSPLTFLFTDIEGSTQRWERSPDEMRQDLAEHDRILREGISAAGGQVFKTVGDAFYATFPSPVDAVQAAISVQRRLSSARWIGAEPVRVRVAIHVGEAVAREGDYFGPTLNRVARVLAAGHGGQVLLTSAAAAAASPLSPGAWLRDLGERRLKDLASPERIFQLSAPELTEAFPPLKTLDARPNNLPARTGPLIGRTRDLQTAIAKLMRRDVRLVTLSGLGGSGKTRLAVEIAAALVDAFPHGAWFVPLASVPDPALVPAAIAETLELRESTAGTPMDRLLGHFRERTALLVLDNFEHVAEAASVVSELLAGAPGLKILTTTRKVLRLTGEHDLPVPPLDTPRGGFRTLEELRDNASVQLFLERASASSARFALSDANAPTIARLCALLDGLPLAIELAAPRVRVMQPEQILERLERGPLDLLSRGARDLPDRQRTLRATIEWSDGLLSPPLRRIFHALGVFVGGWTVDAAEQVVTDAELPLLDALESLLDQSLVQVDGAGRFRMLETLREYALEQLGKEGRREALRKAHVDCFLRLAREVVPSVFARRDRALDERLEAENGNLRAALQTATELPGLSAQAVELAGRIAQPWFDLGRWSEATQWLDRALGLPQAQVAPSHQALARVRRADVHFAKGRFADARVLLEEGIRLYEGEANRDGRVDATIRLFWIAIYQNDPGAAQRRLDQLVGYAADVESPRVLAEIRSLQSWHALESGDRAAAERLSEEAITLLRQVGDRFGMIFVLNARGEFVRGTGDAAGAEPWYLECLEIAREFRTPRWQSVVLGNLAMGRLSLGDAATARPYLRESWAIQRELADRRNVPSMATSVSMLRLLEGDASACAKLLAAAESTLTAMGAQMVFADREAFEDVRRRCMDALDADAYLRATREGAALDPDGLMRTLDRELAEGA